MKVLPPEAVRRAHPVLSSVGSKESASKSSRPPEESFSQVLSRIGRRIDEGERAMDRAATKSSVSLDPGEMLALQAQVYRYVEAVDLAAKLVERATTAVKTTLQNQ